jgi:hypothetical protein
LYINSILFTAILQLSHCTKQRHHRKQSEGKLSPGKIVVSASRADAFPSAASHLSAKSFFIPAIISKKDNIKAERFSVSGSITLDLITTRYKPANRPMVQF